MVKRLVRRLSGVLPIDYGEQHFVTFGLLEGRVVAVVHTEAGVLAWVRAQGKGYQTQINAILKAYKEAHEAQSQ